MKLHLAVAIVLTAVSGTARASIELDGVLGSDSYGTSETNVSWYNGHKEDKSVYKHSDGQTTTIRYSVDTLAGDTSGISYFFLYVEVPLYAKNMIWESKGKDGWKDDYPISNTDPNAGLTEADVAPYRPHHETHHGPGDLKLDFNGATGSEKLVLLDSSGDKKFEANLDKGVGLHSSTSDDGLVAFRDSVDYLLDTSDGPPISTEALSLARDTTMSFEFMFALDTQKNLDILAYVRNGIEFHLSPERRSDPQPQIPEPTTLVIWSLLATLGLSVGWRQRRRAA